MATIKYILLIAFVGVVVANPAIKSTEFWNGTPLDGMVEEMRSNCNDGSDSMACIKVKVMSFLDTIFKKDNYQLTDDVEVRSNGYVSNNEGRGQNDILNNIEQYIQSHDVTFNMPFADAKVTVSPRNIDNNELTLKMKLPSTDEGRGRKHKLKRIAIPIMVFILLKAMTLIPLALGVLGLKAWNALQLGFLSFLVSVGLAIFQLCKKIAIDHHHPAAIAHGPWDVRSFSDAEPVPDFDAQNLAYNAYA